MHTTPATSSAESFAALRQSGRPYVDKTALIARLARNRTKLTLSRPPGFGKSLFLSTLQSLFATGLKDFHGLQIEGLWNHGKTYRVVRLDFKNLLATPPGTSFEAAFEKFLSRAFAPFGFRYGSGYILFLDQIAMWLKAQPDNSLVVLIDDVDAPVLAACNDRTAYEQVTGLLATFFLLLKECEGCLRFLMLTATTKFALSPELGDFNVLYDTSLDNDYGTLLGFTADEIKENFSSDLIAVGKALQLPDEAVLTHLQQKFGGYRSLEATDSATCPASRSSTVCQILTNLSPRGGGIIVRSPATAQH